MGKTNLILCAYHRAGCAVLEQVLKRDDIGEVAVFTHEPKVEGTPDVRDVAEKHGVWHTTRNISKVEELPFAPDVISSVWYRFIIKPHIIQACEGRIFNVHPSLLPRFRGCSSVPWAIIEGDRQTGVTYHYIDEDVDTGRLLLQASLPIRADETQATLYERVMDKAVAFWPAAFELVRSGFRGVEQEGDPSYFPRGVPHEGEIDDTWPLERVERFIRAMIFPPLPAAKYRGEEVTSMERYLELLGRDPERGS